MKLRAGKGKRALVGVSNRGANQSGFTLIETTIALCVMMIVSLGAASLFVYAINYNSGANDRAMALAIAQQRMERLRQSPPTDASLSTDSVTESITNADRPFTVVTTVCSTSACGGSATLKIITIQVTPDGATKWASGPITIVSQRSFPTLGSYAPY